MNNYSLTHSSVSFFAILAAILEFTFTRYFLNPVNDYSGFLDPQNLGKDTKFFTSRQIPMELYWV